jgi:hypothetical protein
MSYSQLKSDIEEFAARGDVGTKTEMFIRLAEAEIYRRVRVLEMETDVTLTFASDAYEDDLPEGFMGFKRLTLPDSPEGKTKYIGPDLFHSLRGMAQSEFARVLGEARLMWTMESNKVKVNTPRGSPEPIELTGVYFKRFEPLSDLNATNALLTAHPDLFLYASLIQLWDWADELEPVAKYTARMDKAIIQIDALELQRRRAPGEWSRTLARGVAV